MGSPGGVRKLLGWLALALVMSISFAVDWSEVLEPNCSLNGKRCERAADGSWLIADKELRGDTTVVLKSGDLLLRDVHIFQARSVTFVVLCSCDIRGEAFTIQGNEATSLRLTGAESWRGTPTSDVSLRGVSARNLGGFYVSMISGNLSLADLTVSCPPQNSFFSIAAPPGLTSIRLSDVDVDGCNGLSYIDDRDRDNDNAGLEAVPVDLIRVHLNGFGPFYTGHNQGVSGPADSAFDLTVTDSVFSNFDSAIAVQQGGSLVLRNSTLTNNDHGITASEGTVIVVEDSVLSDNRYAIRVRGDSVVQVTDSSFLRNGRVPFSGPGDCGGAIMGSFTGFVHGSTFAGNTMAVEGELGPSVALLDATENYWGSPSGPTVKVIYSSPGVCLPTSPAGDQVGTGVLFLPFLPVPP